MSKLTPSHRHNYYYLFAPEANIYSPIISGAPYSLWSKSWPSRDKMHKETLFSIDRFKMWCSTSRWNQWAASKMDECAQFCRNGLQGRYLQFGTHSFTRTLLIFCIGNIEQCWASLRSRFDKDYDWASYAAWSESRNAGKDFADVAQVPLCGEYQQVETGSNEEHQPREKGSSTSRSVSDNLDLLDYRYDQCLAWSIEKGRQWVDWKTTPTKELSREWFLVL